MKMLRINSGHVRHAPHEGVVCTMLRVAVTLTDKPIVEHNGVGLVTIIDSQGEEHLVDPYFLEDSES